MTSLESGMLGNGPVPFGKGATKKDSGSTSSVPYFIRKGIERKGLATAPRSQSTLHHQHSFYLFCLCPIFHVSRLQVYIACACRLHIMSPLATCYTSILIVSTSSVSRSLKE